MVLASIALSCFTAQATIFTFNSNDASGNITDMNDLEHGYYYGWSLTDGKAAALGAELVKGYEIKSATLTFTNIYNWVHETDDQLNSFLLAGPPLLPGGSETVPVVINGVPQGHDLYTYTKTTTATNISKPISTVPSKYPPPAGYTLASYIYDSTTKKYTYTSTKTTISTKSSTSTTPPGAGLQTRRAPGEHTAGGPSLVRLSGGLP